MPEQEFTKYEIARILGARALQVAMDAPILLKLDKKELEKINYDPLKIAELEFEADVLPITVKRPMPKKKEEKLKTEKPEKTKEEIKKEEEKEEKEIEKKEEEEKRKIREESEIMELAKPEDEKEEVEEEKGPAV